MNIKTLTILIIINLLFVISNSTFAQQSININQVETHTIADSLRNYYLEKQRFDTALVYANQALTLVEKQYGKNDTLYADMLGGIMYVYGYSGNFKEAIKYCLQEKQIREKKQGKEHSAYGTVLNNLAFLYNTIGNSTKALPLYLEALENCEKSLGKENSEYGIRLNNLGGLYRIIGNYEKALPLCLEALENCEKSLGKEHSNYGIYLNNLAFLYQVMGNYEKALPLYIEALENCEKFLGKEHSDYGLSLNNLASLYETMGNYEKALPLYIEALENCEKSLGKENSDYGLSLNNLAVLYGKIGNSEKALPLYLEALENCEKFLGKEHSDYGQRLNNLAGLYETMGNYEKALPLYREALENGKKSLGKEHSDYAVRLNNLASLYETMGNYEKALPLYIEALENCEKSLGKKNSLYGIYLNNLALLYNTIGNYEKALSLFLESIDNVNYNITKNFSFLSEKEKEAYFNMKSGKFDVFNSFALQTNKQFNNITTTVFDNTVRNKGILLKSSTAMRTAILSSNDTVLINKYNNWINLKKEIAKLYSVPIKKRQQDPKQLEEQATVFERDLVKSSEEFSAFTQTLKTNWQDIQKALKPNELAIEFVHFQLYEKDWTDTTIYCALIVSPNRKQPEMIPLFREKQLEKIIGKFGGNNYSYINSIYGKNTEVNKDLYNLVWKPMEESLKGAKKIYLSPSGLLHKISFAAIAKEQNVYLCDAYQIEVKSSTGKITEQKNQNQQMNTATLFGGITYDTDSTTQKIWSYLEGTKTETQKIDKILKNGEIDVVYFSNTTATEEEFKLMASNSNILHIATHGFFYPDPKEIQEETEKNVEVGEITFRGGSRGFGVNSFVENTNPLMRSGLVFAGANDVWSKQNKNDSIDDGVLTAQEVSNIDMRKTDLVVMSACETGLGDIKGSEGVYGLQRAFKMAGVDFMIMSLWQVPDKETEEFMASFYKKLIKQKDIKKAFAETQKEMRIKYDPYFWAAFVLIE